MKILVTGGAGYVGSHACKALAAAGHEPVVYDSLITGHREAVRWGPLERGDLHDSTRLRAVIESHAPAAVLHFAAFAYAGESVTEPRKYYRNNVAGTVALADVLLDTGIDKLIFSSTCATYGAPDSLPINESAPQRPVSPYGRSKLMIEQILADYDAAYGLKTIALRYFNVAGCDPDGEIGECHDPETHLIPLVIDAALGRSPALTINGDDYPTADGTCVRDYIHVSDLADAHVLALNALLQGGKSAAYNLGSARGYSVREIIDAVKRASGREFDVIVGPRRAGDPPGLYADASLFKSTFDWHPRFDTLDAIVRTALDWAQRNEPQQEAG